MSAATDRYSAGRDAALDGLRGAAIALILWRHLAEAFLPAGRGSWLGWLRAGTDLSWCGVDLFFVLSGFFIGGILIDRRDSPRLCRVFYLRRALRILPIYTLTLAAIFAAIALRLPAAYHEFPAWVYALFLTNFWLAHAGTWDWLPLSVLWSVAVEEQFYLAAPWIVRLLPPSSLPWCATGLALLCWAARVALLLVFPGGRFAFHVLMPLRMDGLALGVLLAWAVRHGVSRRFFTRLGARWKTWLAGATLALAGLAALRPAEGSPTLCLFGYALIAAYFALVLAIVAGVRPPALNRLLAFRPLAHLGRHSYFIYLWHGLIGLGVIRLLAGGHFQLNSPAGLAVVALAVAATWGAAMVSWKFFEGPLVAWGHRHAY